jgi:hypothetical protein
MKAVQLAKNPMDIVPSEVMRLLATPEGKTFGYGYGPGWSLMFGSEHGDIQVEPGEWVVRHSNGAITVQAVAPEPTGEENHV